MSEQPSMEGVKRAIPLTLEEAGAFIAPYKGNPNLHKPGVTFEWTKEMLEEFRKCAEDPLYFVENYIKIETLDYGLVKFRPYEYQKKILKTTCFSRFSIIKLPRQSGKTTIIIGVILWHLLFNRRFKIGIAAHKQDQAVEIMDRLRLAYEKMPFWLQQGVLQWNKKKIVLENGSTITASATSGSAIRGGTYNLIYMDEFAFVQPNVQKKFYTSVLPAISAGKRTKIIITSTPNGLDQFYEIWNGSEMKTNSFKRVEIHWSETPGRDDAWAEQMLETMTQDEFDQEFGTDFLGSSGTLINGKVLAKLQHVRPVETLPSGLNVWKRPSVGGVYVVSCDVAHGVRLDYSAVVVVDITKYPYEVVATYHSNILPYLALPDVLHNICMYYNQAPVIIETMDVGQAVADSLLFDIGYENTVMTVTTPKKGTVVGGGFNQMSKLGVRTNKLVKKLGCAALKLLIEQRKLVLNDFAILKELKVFEVKGKSYEAKEGHHDDLVMALVIFSWLVNQEFFKDLIANDLKKAIIQESHTIREEDLTPFGYIDHGEEPNALEDTDKGWTVVEDWESKMRY